VGGLPRAIGVTEREKNARLLDEKSGIVRLERQGFADRGTCFLEPPRFLGRNDGAQELRLGRFH
jgi:hypothetical protein